MYAQLSNKLIKKYECIETGSFFFFLNVCIFLRLPDSLHMAQILHKHFFLCYSFQNKTKMKNVKCYK